MLCRFVGRKCWESGRCQWCCSYETKKQLGVFGCCWKVKTLRSTQAGNGQMCAWRRTSGLLGIFAFWYDAAFTTVHYQRILTHKSCCALNIRPCRPLTAAGATLSRNQSNETAWNFEMPVMSIYRSTPCWAFHFSSTEEGSAERELCVEPDVNLCWISGCQHPSARPYRWLFLRLSVFDLCYFVLKFQST